MCNNVPDRRQRTTKTSRRSISISLVLKPSGEAYIGSGENDKRYRHHQPASRQKAGLQVLVLVNPNNPILHSHTQPD
jgi:hypothetical protein